MKDSFYEMFPGGNTPKGFFSYYNYIYSPNSFNKIFILKGGPGSGKSTLMKHVAKYYKEKGLNVELHHCSSDPDSLDGVVIRDIKCAIIDGTSPHVVDPIYPGASEEIINLGDAFNISLLREHKQEIIDISLEIKHCFFRAYKYLAASKLLFDDLKDLNTSMILKEDVEKCKNSLINSIFKNESKGFNGEERHLFATAFTPKGVVTYIDSLIEEIENIYVLRGDPGTKKSEILEHIYKYAINSGYHVECYHQPLYPEALEHIIIPELNSAILTTNEINLKNMRGIQIYTDNFLKCKERKLIKSEVDECKENFHTTLNKALELIFSAKSFHDELEKYYVKAVDFSLIEEKENFILDAFNNFLP